MGGQVAVAESEPVGLHAVGGEFLFGMPGFVAMAPPALGVDPAAEGVHTRVEIGADPHPEHPRVVPDVDHRGQLVVGLDLRGVRAELSQPEQPLYAEQEACPAYAADQYRHLHIERD